MPDNIWFNPGAPGQDNPTTYGGAQGTNWVQVGLDVFSGLLDLFGSRKTKNDNFVADPRDDDGLITGDNNVSILNNPVAVAAGVIVLYLLLNRRR